MIIENHIKNMSPAEIAQWLQENAPRVEEGEYFKPYDAEDMQEAQAEFSTLSLQLTRVEGRFEKVKTEFKAEMKPLKSEIREVLTNMSQNGEHVDGKLFLFDNQETGMMESYNIQGQIVSTRRLRPEERQLNIRSINSKTA